ncbi:MAG: hypothetical protein Roseis2KO_41480 [Roseivirga sp.]
MEKKVISTNDELLSLLLRRERWSVLNLHSNGLRYDLVFNDCKINPEFNFELIEAIISSINFEHSLWKPVTLKFNRCDFDRGFDINDKILTKNKPLDTEDVHFEHYEFTGCQLSSVDLKNTSFTGKLRFHECTINDLNLSNTKFNDLVDFWRSTFNKPVTFYKTDFLGTTNFSGCSFNKNVLFTYALIEKLIIFRGTKFEKGLDLSLAIIPGEISCFDIQLGYFSTAKRIKRLDETKYEALYEEAVSDNAQIPVNNARETYRILKQTLVSQNSVSDSIRFKVMENRKLLQKSCISFNIKTCYISFTQNH